ncbi:MAG: hypothetical protein MZU95_02845 [Desulfomicrobium escambiense]|nr:hypothetical protein [Desulfomicrobium escambiense]
MLLSSLAHVGPGTEAGNPGPAQPVAKTGGEGRFGSHNYKVNPVVHRRLQGISGERALTGECSGSGVPGIRPGTLFSPPRFERPCKGVLPAAASDNENLSFCSALFPGDVFSGPGNPPDIDFPGRSCCTASKDDAVHVGVGSAGTGA